MVIDLRAYGHIQGIAGAPEPDQRFWHMIAANDAIARRNPRWKPPRPGSDQVEMTSVIVGQTLRRRDPELLPGWRDLSGHDTSVIGVPPRLLETDPADLRSVVWWGPFACGRCSTASLGFPREQFAESFAPERWAEAIAGSGVPDPRDPRATLRARVESYELAHGDRRGRIGAAPNASQKVPFFRLAEGRRRLSLFASPDGFLLVERSGGGIRSVMCEHTGYPGGRNIAADGPLAAICAEHVRARWPQWEFDRDGPAAAGAPRKGRAAGEDGPFPARRCGAKTGATAPARASRRR